MPGYSGTPLAAKLGIKAGHRIVLVSAPDEFDDVLGELPPDAVVSRSLPRSRRADVIVLFCGDEKSLVKGFDRAARALDFAGGLWVAWPKKSSGVKTDLDENVVRAHGLATGLVDNKVCAVTDVWSGLRFVYRVKDRPAKGENTRVDR